MPGPRVAHHGGHLPAGPQAAVDEQGRSGQTWGVFELTTGARILELDPRQQAVFDVAVGELDGRPVIVTGGQDGTVRVWDLDGGAPLGMPLGGDDEHVIVVAVAELDGRAG